MNPLTVLQDLAPSTKSVPIGDPHVTFVRLPTVSHYLAFSRQAVPPIGLAYLAACLEEQGTKVSIVDAVVEGLSQITPDGEFRLHGITTAELVEHIPSDTHVIGFSCMFSQEWPWHRDAIMAVRERFPQAIIVAGGEHISALAEFCLHDCPAIDICVIGEGEETIVELTNAIKQGEDWSAIKGLGFLRDGEYVATCRRPRIRQIDSIPRPAWHLFPMERYLENPNIHGVYSGERTMPMLATRGCPYKCTFCTNPSMYGVLYMTRKPSDVLDEIEEYMRVYRATTFLFYDLTFVLKKSWVLEFCRGIEERGLKFHWQLPTGTRSEVIDDEVASALSRTGCPVMNYAPESGSLDTLKIIKKQVNLENLLESVRASRRFGINIKCMLIIGFPHENWRHFWDTLKYSVRLAIAGAHDQPVFIYTAHPGGELFDELRADGSIPAVDDSFFKSLTVYTNPFSSKHYCKGATSRELVVWRFAIILLFYLVQFSLRPWRFISFFRSAYQNRYTTYTEQRFGQSLRRLLGKNVNAPTRVPAGQAATIGSAM
ncbi:MAG: cobalamin-dependent protein [Pirellulales bacterium]|nr:cobalamin-dependent protein [Pirellulales bacterium]